MSCSTSPLARVRVTAPCKAEWDEMRGDERVRFCGRCNLNVYNLSAMSRREAERLVVATEGRLCVRFYRRADGTMLTQNCPVGLAALKRRASRVASAAFAVAISFLAGVGIAPTTTQKAPQAQVLPTQPAPAVSDEAFDLVAGGGYYDPVADPFVPGGMLAVVIFVIGYPLTKLRARREARRSEELHIWRQ